MSVLKTPHRSTGPTSIEGKARSSMNRLTHGCRSSKTVLPDEDPAEYEASLQAWYDQYQPAEDDDIAAMLVEETGNAHWVFKRNRKRLEEVEHRMPCDAGLWIPDHDRQFSNAVRYKTTAERAFFRWFNELERHFGRIHRREHMQQLAYAKLRAAELQSLRKPQTLEQVVEVSIVDGQCQTEYFPSNEELIEQAKQFSRNPVCISRLILLIDGVPPEYDWARPHLTPRETCPGALQKMSCQKWLQLIEIEKLAGHAQPTWTLLR